ncbi:MAG TPA: hypothetical protein VMQ93_04000 [Novosphingobium sp.]|nr:hypothetical protein [Novosphingobium sp.]
MAMRLAETIHAFRADEIVMTCWTHDPVDRLRSCRLLAERLGAAVPA